MTCTFEILKLIKDFENYSNKLNWMENNNWTFKICTKNNNPFNEHLEYWNISHHVLELQAMINKRKNKLKNFYKNNYVKKTNIIFQ